MLVAGNPEVPERSLVPVLQARAADHLGADEAGPVAAPLAPKGLDADPGHRGQDQAGGDLNHADPPGFSKIYLHRAGNSTPRAC